MQGVNPKWVFYLGILVTIELGIGGGSVKLTNAFPEAWQPFIVSWCNILGFIGTSIMTALSGFSSRAAGPLVSAPAGPAAKAGVIILLGLLLLAPDQAYAQPKKIGGQAGQVLDKLGVQPIGQPQGSGDAAVAGATTGSNGDALARLLAKPFNDLADFINSDTAGAAALASKIPELQDGHGQQCWMAMGQFTSVLKAHPIPVTLHAATDLEAFRLAAMAANNLCHNASCNQVFTDLANSIQKAAPVNLGIPIPSLSSLCAYVPQVTVIPTTPAAAAPATPQ